MPWWAWIAVGGVLFALEVAIQTEFWLAIVGGAALLVGSAVWLASDLPLAGQWLLLGVFSVLLATTIRRRIHEKLVGRARGIAPDLVEDEVTAREQIAPGALGTVDHRGSRWQARNVGQIAIAAGASARVERVDGIVLEVSD